MRKFKNVIWEIKEAANNKNAVANTDEALLSVSMDIRDELRELNKFFKRKIKNTNQNNLK